MEAYLRSVCASPHVEVLQQGGAGAETPTWADDVVVLFQVDRAEQVPGLLSELGSQVVSRLHCLGLEANLGPGKTEALVAMRGAASRTARRALLTADNPSVPLHLSGPEGTGPRLRIVQSYTHLGTVVCSELSEVANLRHRGALMRSAFKPICNKLMHNPYLTFQEKRDLLLGRVLPKFFYGAGLWRLHTVVEREMATGPVHAVLRRCVRPFTGNSSARMTQGEVLAALDVPGPDELLDVYRARALAKVIRHDMEPAWQGSVQDGVWLRAACESADRVYASLGLAPVFAKVQDSAAGPAADLVQAQADRIRTACKAFLRKRRAERPPVDWRDVLRRQEAGASLEVVSCAGLAFPHKCQLCSAQFASHRRLSVHLSKCHEVPGIGMRHAFGSRCEVCKLEFWTLKRLAAHLARSEVCRRVYQESDLEPEGAGEAAPGPAWRPSAPSFGPTPFWACLRPG